MGYRIIFSPRAQRDLRNIKRYISRDSPLIAERFCQKLVIKTEMLGVYPEIGRKVPDFDNRTLREIIIGNYRVIYRVDLLAKQIEIVRYWNAARGTPEL
ncbi:MAG: type II toxin-antitoxin system RelE/ParE family toxin [Chthoniobacterales bacterium]|nr:type II toxin-antitoxin system RelE/ParE family toxin [Chthoniobacterales bacterium]